MANVFSHPHSETVGSVESRPEWPYGEAAFVTGAASGIGLGIARALVSAGAKVALADIDGARLAAVVEELNNAGGQTIGVELDISDPDAWTVAADRAEDALGPISILCNNAGVHGGSAVDQTPLEVWRWVNRINVEGQFIGVSTFLARFKQRGKRAHIMNTASMSALVPMVDNSAYTASKFASLGFSLVLRDEVRGSDIGVSVLCPGSAATRLSETAELEQAKLLGRDPNLDAIARNSASLALGADPDLVGIQVLEAMQDRQFLIITHREWEPLVLRVQDEIRGAFTEFDSRHGVDPVPGILLGGGNPITS
ncbi:SDR family oxidoreductase [Paenarthrobacter sp. NPDC089322]|uniref:SDR family NAD(P)-dependent oxidoreductase n=1 Tax=Paenarthrobacter sp. NPDC089322 TaxID=3155065 RepID=UPI00342A396A